MSSETEIALRAWTLVVLPGVLAFAVLPGPWDLLGIVWWPYAMFGAFSWEGRGLPLCSFELRWMVLWPYYAWRYPGR